MKKIISIILCLVMIFSVFATIPFSVGAKEVDITESSASNVLPLNASALYQVGHQNHSGFACSCFALAYCRTILDGYAHSFSEYNRYGNNEYEVDCIWGNGNYLSASYSNPKQELRAAYDQINAGRPSIIYVSSSQGQHWVTVVGYQNVSDPNNLSAGNMLVIDPWNGYQGSPVTCGYSIGAYNSKIGVMEYRCIYTNSGSVAPVSKYKLSVDAAEGLTNQVHVGGWIFDSTNYSRQIELHVYIGGPDNITGEGFSGIIASNYRHDVNAAYGCGDYHGFDATLNTTKTGPQPVYIYAIGDKNEIVWQGTINIQSEKDAPTVSEITISQVTSKGYRVSCKVTDNSGIGNVVIPGWTDIEHGSDQVWYQATISNGYASVYIPSSDHNYSLGPYATHIYASDIYGNAVSVAAPDTYLSDEPIVIDSIKMNDNRYVLLNSGFSWNQAKEWCEKNGGHLVTITSEKEWNVIEVMLSKYNYVACWLGANDLEGYWKWITGEEFSYSYWGPGQPDGKGVEHYLGTWGSIPYIHCTTWNDFGEPAGNTGGFICEFEPTSIKGDANKDGQVSISDVTCIQQYLAHLIDDNEIDLMAATMINTQLSISDATHLQKYLANLITEL